MAQWQTTLREAVATVLPDADERLADSLIDYLNLLLKWNAAYNLTAVRDPAEMVTRHILDSLVILPYLEPTRLLDVGSGPGLPGIPLALACPEMQVTLLDSNGKKTRFCRQAVTALKLRNVEVQQARVEEFRPDAGFPQIISRAFASLADFVAGTRHLLAEDGELFAMKGAWPEQEIAELTAARVVESHRLEVPGLAAERYLLKIIPT